MTPSTPQSSDARPGSPKVLYFAYGSNMCPARLESRGLHVQAQGKALLKEHELAFNKHGADNTHKANIRTADGGEVWGGLYELSRAELEVLRGFEGGYSSREVRVEVGGRQRTATTFQADQECTKGCGVSPDYRDLVLCGAQWLELPEGYVQSIRRAAQEN